MADLYTAEAQNQSDAATSQASRVEDSTLTGGKEVRFRVTHTTAATDAANDVLYLLQLPKDAVLNRETIRCIAASTPGTAYNIDAIGDLADADRYCATALDMGGGGFFTPTPAATTPKYKARTDAADTGWVTATLHTLTSITAGAEIVFTGTYTIRN